MVTDIAPTGEGILQTESHHQRQSRIIHPNTASASVLVVGAGMIGGWTTHALARMVRCVHVVDFDVVESVNVGCQPYNSGQAGFPKSLELEHGLEGLSVTGYVETFPECMSERIVVFIPEPTIMVSAVDSMAGRKANADWAREHAIDLYLDGRIMGELAALAVVSSPSGYDDYLDSLPTDDEVPDVPCGQQGTAYTGMLVASRIAATINQWHRGVTPPSMWVYHVGAGQVVTEDRGKESDS